VLIIPFCKPLVAAALGINHGPLVQLELDQRHPRQFTGLHKSAGWLPVYRAG